MNARAAALVLLLATWAAPRADAATAVPKMIDIPSGVFVMGAGSDADVEQGKPRHGVHVAAFRIGETDVTFDQYDPFARATGRPLPQDEGFGRGPRPVVNITRADMLAYAAWLNRTSGQTGFRLPSEAEWEYAAHAGTRTTFYWGDAPDPARVNSALNAAPDKFPYTSPVKSFPPNGFGLYDMSGNVWQEVADCLHYDYVGAPADGRAWSDKSCFAYIVRGGSYEIFKRGLTPTARSGIGRSFASMSVGFRLAQDVRGAPARRKRRPN